MMTAGTQFLPNVATWTQARDVRTEAILTGAILLGVAAFIRRSIKHG
jgi:hypothetical protein